MHYFSLKEEKRLDKNDPLIVKVKEAVDKEYEDGRVTVMTDEELISMIRSCCKELNREMLTR